MYSEGMGLIIRTAGAKLEPRQEIKRDYRVLASPMGKRPLI